MRHHLIQSILSFFFLSALLVPASWAGSLSGEISFLKRAPAGVLVYVDGDKGLKDPAIVDQVQTQFTAPITVGPKGTEAVFKNSDTINHNIYANDRDAKINFDIGLAAPGTEAKQNITWEDGTLIKISCKIHPKMRAWLMSLSSQYYQVVPFQKKQKKATFELANVPDSLTKVKVVIPGYETIELDIAKGATQNVPLMKKKKKKGIIKITRS